MEKDEIRAFNKYLFKKRMSQKEIHEDFYKTLRKEFPIGALPIAL
jgi:hypothetical protein